MPKMLSLNDYPSMFEIFKVLRDIPKIFENRSQFLDSSLPGELGRYSIIGFKPYMAATLDGDLKVQTRNETFTVTEEPLRWLSDWLNAHHKENTLIDKIPLSDGGIGYFSYDYGRKKEGVVTRHKEVVHVADFVLEFFSCFFIEDIKEHILYLVAGEESDADDLSVMEEIVNKAFHAKKDSSALEDPNKGAVVTSDFTRDDYMDAISAMIQYIIEGDIYVANMTRQIQVKSDIDPFAFFERLRTNNPSPFGAYLDYEGCQIVCASPERFMRMQDKVIRTRPIKGTRPRGKNEEEDRLNYKELADSDKDKSELLMIIDLERNDLNRICVPGSVKLTELFSVETYATVFHLVSEIEGKLRPELNVCDLINATFPGGSITGAPKLRAMEIVDELEHSLRNIYTGSIGYISLDGNVDFNIVIRTAVYQDGTYHIGAGGGITYESDTAFEYEETDQKAVALIRALGGI